MPSPSFEEGQAPRPDRGERRARMKTLRVSARDEWTAKPSISAVPARLAPDRKKRAAHTQPSAGLRAALRGRLQALPGLRGSHRAEGRGCGRRVLDTNPPSHAIAATAHQKNTAGDCEPYYFDWLKCIDKCAMPHIMQKLK